MTAIALFYASKQTHCGLSYAILKECNFTQGVWIFTEVVMALFCCWQGCCHGKQLPSHRMFCLRHTTMHQFTVSFYSKPRGRVQECLAVICHLHFWQNDRDLVRAAAVTRGWNGCRNKSQHRQWTQVKKILSLLLPGFAPATFRSRVRRSNRWAILTSRPDRSVTAGTE